MGAFFQDLTPEIKVTVAENSERHSMTPTYIHKLNLGVNISYYMSHALTLCFACCRWVVLSVNCFCLHTTVMLTACYLNRQPGRGYHYSETNACGESAASIFCGDPPQKYPQNLHTPKKYSFFWKPQKILKFKILNPKMTRASVYLTCLSVAHMYRIVDRGYDLWLITTKHLGFLFYYLFPLIRERQYYM